MLHHLYTFFSGSWMEVQVEVTTHHEGFFEFRLCPWNDVTTPVTHDCLNQWVRAYSSNRSAFMSSLFSRVKTCMIILNYKIWRQMCEPRLFEEEPDSVCHVSTGCLAKKSSDIVTESVTIFCLFARSLKIGVVRFCVKFQESTIHHKHRIHSIWYHRHDRGYVSHRCQASWRDYLRSVCLTVEISYRYPNP